MITTPRNDKLGDALTKVATALNELYALDERVDIRFGSVMTDVGYVLRGENGRWSVKMKVGGPPAWWGTTSSREPDDE